MPIDAFLRALMRDVAWGFFYGMVNFDDVFGTINHYGEVTMFAGRFNDAYRDAGRDFSERFTSDALMAHLQGDGPRLDQRGLRPLRRADGDRRALGLEARRQRRRGRPHCASPPGAWSACRATRRCAPTTTAIP